MSNEGQLRKKTNRRGVVVGPTSDNTSRIERAEQDLAEIAVPPPSLPTTTIIEVPSTTPPPPGGGFSRPHIVGFWYATEGDRSFFDTLAIGRVYYRKFLVPSPSTYDAAASRVLVPGSGTSTLRIAFHADANGVPAGVVASARTIAVVNNLTDPTLPVITSISPVTLAAGVWWVAVWEEGDQSTWVFDTGNDTTQPVDVSYISPSTFTTPLQQVYLGLGSSGWQQDPPDPLRPSVSGPRIALRRSS